MSWTAARRFSPVASLHVVDDDGPDVARALRLHGDTAFLVGRGLVRIVAPNPTSRPGRAGE